MLPLVVTNLTKRFGAVSAVDDVSFEAEAGKILGLLGPNGAGKTTTISMIATLLRPTAGDAQVAGFSVTQRPEEVRKRIGVLTTETGVYERFTGRENLAYFGELYGLYGRALRQRIEGLVSLLEMEAYIDRKAGGYSTGMKQRLAIARSIVHDPEVLIFDEPNQGLDVLASQTIMNFMRRSREAGKCILFSTHHMVDAQKLCDRIAILHQGRLVVNDTWENIQQKTNAQDMEDAFLQFIGR